MSTGNLQSYYAKRAREYEDIYYRDDPSRQKEQQILAATIKDLFTEKTVLEIACGTGYWTQFAAITAKHVTATDLNIEMLDVARETKQFPSSVELQQADAFNLPFPSNSFTAGLANFWFSHLKISQREQFLSHFHSKLSPGATVFIADNVYNEGIGGKLITKKGEKDSYKLRTLKDGSTSEILKNYPSKQELKKFFTPHAKKLHIFFGKHFWYASYITKISITTSTQKSMKIFHIARNI